jgi:hypothetical protein
MLYRFYVFNKELNSAELFNSLKEYNVVSVSMTYEYVELDFAEEPSSTTLTNIQKLLNAGRVEKVEAVLP